MTTDMNNLDAPVFFTTLVAVLTIITILVKILGSRMRKQASEDVDGRDDQDVLSDEEDTDNDDDDDDDNEGQDVKERRDVAAEEEMSNLENPGMMNE